MVRAACIPPRVRLRMCSTLLSCVFVGLFVTVVNKFYVGRDQERHALLAPITRVATRVVLAICGYSVRANSPRSTSLRLTHRVLCS